MTNGAEHKVMPADEDVIRRSVTRDDYQTKPQGGIYHFLVPAYGSGVSPDLPAFWSFARDQVLFSTLYRESVWAAALSIAITKIVAMGFEIKSEIPLRQKRAQQLFVGMNNNKGWAAGITKHLQSFLLTGNGGHVEIVRATAGAGSRIIGLVPLDSFRCLRTGDPDVPVIYRDRMGRMHEMKDYQVFSISDMPDQADTWYDIGHCAAERAYRAICKLEAMERFVFEKVSGQRALSIYLVGGVSPTTITDAIASAKGEAQAKGQISYMGAAIAALMGDTPANMVEIPLAGLPTGFERKEEFDIVLLTYARAIGLPVQDLQPLSGQGLGTGKQTEVLEESSKGQGLAAWRHQFDHMANWHVLDDRTTFAISTSDMRDKEREAKIHIDEAAALKTWVDIGLPPQMAINIGVDRDQLPREAIEQDATAGDTLSDDEKPAVALNPDGSLPPIGETQAMPLIGQVVRSPVPLISAKEVAPGDLLTAAERVRAMAADMQHAAERQLEAAATVQSDYDAQTVKALTGLTQAVLAAVDQPETPPSPPIIHVTAPPPMPAQVIVQSDPQLRAAVKELSAVAAELRDAQPAEHADAPRRFTVTKRDAEGRVLEWEEA